MKKANQGAKPKGAGGKNKAGKETAQNPPATSAKNEDKEKHPAMDAERKKQRAQVAAMIKTPVVTLRWYQLNNVNGELECQPYVDLDMPETQVLYTDEMRKLPTNKLLLCNKEVFPPPEVASDVPAFKAELYDYSSVNVALDNMQAFARTTNPARDAMVLTNVGLGLRGPPMGNLGRLHREVARNSFAYKGHSYIDLAAEFCEQLMGGKGGNTVIERGVQVVTEQQQGYDDIVRFLSTDAKSAKPSNDQAVKKSSRRQAMDFVELSTVQAFEAITHVILDPETWIEPGRRDVLVKWLLEFTLRQEYSLKTYYVAVNVVDSVLRGSDEPKNTKFLALTNAVKGLVYKRHELRGINFKVGSAGALRAAQRNLKLAVGEYCFRPQRILVLDNDTEATYNDVAKFLIEMCCLSREMHRFEPPAISMACYVISYRLIGAGSDLPWAYDDLLFFVPIESLTPHQTGQMRPITKQIVAMILASPPELLIHVFWKRATLKFDPTADNVFMYGGLMKALLKLQDGIKIALLRADAEAKKNERRAKRKIKHN